MRHSRGILLCYARAADNPSSQMTESPGALLRVFLEDPRRPADTWRYHELQGFLFAVARAPELVKPSEWMPIVFGDQPAEYASLEEAREVTAALMAVYNSINVGVYGNQAVLPDDCQFRDHPLANLEDDAPVAQWSRGFLRGHQWLEESWDYASMLLALSFFASKKLAEAFCAEARHPNLAAMASTIVKVFPDAVAQYAHLGRSIQQVITEADSSEAPRARSAKVGRNAPCPCGSGRKYKKCCGAAA